MNQVIETLELYVITTSNFDHNFNLEISLVSKNGKFTKVYPNYIEESLNLYFFINTTIKKSLKIYLNAHFWLFFKKVKAYNRVFNDSLKSDLILF